MLVLSRKKNEIIDVGPDIEITVVEIRGDKVRLGISAPRHVRVNRREVTNRIRRLMASGKTLREIEEMFDCEDNQ